MAINTGVNVSKLVSYAVLGPPPGVSVSKEVAYAVLGVPAGVSVSKEVSYAVLGVPKGVSASKTVAYAVLSDVNTTAPTWPVVTPPIGFVAVPYSLSWDLSPPSAQPVTYSLLSGSLPGGLTLSGVGLSGGNIAGTPTLVGVYTFTISATNAYGTANKTLTITINTTPVSGTTSYVFVS